MGFWVDLNKVRFRVCEKRTAEKKRGRKRNVPRK